MATTRNKRVNYKEESDVSSTDSKSPNLEWKSKCPLKEPKKKNQKENIDANGKVLSNYEMIRLKNIQEREKLLRSMGMDAVLNEMNSLAPEINTVTEIEPLQTTRKVRTLLPRKKIKLTMQLRNRDKKSSMDDFDSTLPSNEEDNIIKDERVLGSVSMKSEEESFDEFLGNLKSHLKNRKKIDPNIDLTTCDLKSFKDSWSCYKMVPVLPKVVSTRVQSICVHPITSKRLVIAGSTAGHIGLWDMDIPYDKLEENGNNSLLKLQPHLGPTNCLTVSLYDECKIYSTSHDGTVLCVDLDHMMYDNICAMDFDSYPKHLTWHKQISADTLLIAHGNGSVGILDRRERSCRQLNWMACFPRSVRTVDIHPTDGNYFLAASGTGACRIFDLRSANKKNFPAVCQFDHPKGLTSAFFSGSGNNVLTTCNNDILSVYNVINFREGKVKVKSKAAHNNHNGRWLSVFKAIWYPSRDDTFLIGSLMNPRRIQFYNSNGTLVSVLMDEVMTTISPVLAVHPQLPLIVGGNSSGKVHAFQTDDN